MKKLIKILHIDLNWQVVYVLISDGTLIKSTVPLETALIMLKTDKFDLILSEPQQIAALTPQAATGGLESIAHSLAAF